MEQLIEILLNYVEPDEEITSDTKIKEDLGMSSFDLVCLAEDIFGQFGVRLTADNFRQCKTVGSLTGFIKGE